MTRRKFLSLVGLCFALFSVASQGCRLSILRKGLVTENQSSLESRGGISLLEGASVNLWSMVGAIPGQSSQLRIQLIPGRPVILGRQDGGTLDYLHPAFVATPIAPGSDYRSVLRFNDNDIYLSRAHCMLSYHRLGILLTNGVPDPQGQIRTSVNPVWILSSTRRKMAGAERVLIPHGGSKKIWLPNGTVLLINAE